MENEREIEITDGDAAAKEAAVESDQKHETERSEASESEATEDVLKQKIAELEDKLLRQVAEFENYKKRQARLLDDMARSQRERTLSDLLEIVDNFERALKHAEEEEGNGAMREGTEMIYNQLKSFLERYDVKPIEAVGQNFDPNLHEAMMQVETDEYEPGVIAVEVTKGYTIGDRVLRHSKVGVARESEK
jgi:molecular chaperone GrpE